MGVSLHMCVWTICMLGACWGRKRSLDLWNWSCRWLWDTIWVLGIVSMSSGVSTSALDCWATSTRTWPILTTKVPVSGGTMCHSVHVEVRKQLYGVNSFYSFFFIHLYVGFGDWLRLQGLHGKHIYSQNYHIVFNVPIYEVWYDVLYVIYCRMIQCT